MGGGSAGSTTSTGSGAGSGGGNNSPPEILVLAANTTQLHVDETLLLTVVATDADGIDDLIGGVVLAPGGASYGALVTSGQEGSYELALTWAQLGAVEPIDADQSGQLRTFVVTLFDASSAEATGTVDVTLSCGDPDLGVCSGDCTNFDTSSAHCGTCGFDCADDFGGALVGGYCLIDGGHFCTKGGISFLDAGTGDLTCNQACAAAGGPEAYYAAGTECDLIDANCVVPVSCDTSVVSLPAECVDDDTFIECLCVGYYLSPG
jgi:hypothetical protein